MENRDADVTTDVELDQSDPVNGLEKAFSSSSENEMVLECSEVFDIALVTDFKAMLQQAVNVKKPIVFDATTVERIDAAALQLLAAFFIDAEHTQTHISWRNPSEVLCSAAELTGLSEVLHL